MALQLNFAARSDVGRVRSKNDDSAYVGRYLAVVADGMGGHVGGDVASASVVLDLAPLDRNDHTDPGTMLADEIQSANLILNDLVHDNPKLAGMGTTCTAVLVDNNVYTWRTSETLALIELKTTSSNSSQSITPSFNASSMKAG